MLRQRVRTGVWGWNLSDRGPAQAARLRQWEWEWERRSDRGYPTANAACCLNMMHSVIDKSRSMPRRKRRGTLKHEQTAERRNTHPSRGDPVPVSVVPLHVDIISPQESAPDPEQLLTKCLTLLLLFCSAPRWGGVTEFSPKNATDTIQLDTFSLLRKACKVDPDSYGLRDIFPAFPPFPVLDSWAQSGACLCFCHTFTFDFVNTDFGTCTGSAARRMHVGGGGGGMIN